MNKAAEAEEIHKKLNFIEKYDIISPEEERQELKI